MSDATLRCPMCGGTDCPVAFRSHHGYDIVRCTACGLAFTDARTAPPPSQLYPHFEQTDTASQRTARNALSLFTLQRARLVESLTSGRRLLDYGAGSGAFARFMSGRGFDVVGLEPYSLGVTFEAPRLRLIRAPLAQARPSLDRFDVITLWHVLEHVERPVELLTELKGLLAPGGVVVVSVPNLASWQARSFQGRWFHLDPPRHLLHFEPDTLARCLDLSGLTVAGQYPFLPEYGTSGWIQSALNLLLPHENFLYEWVKDRGALARMPAAARGLHFAASVAVGGPVLLASLPVELAASRSNRAAALTVAARPVT